MSEEIKNQEVNADDFVGAEIDVPKKIQDIVHSTLKSKIKGRIYAKVKEKEENEENNVLYVSISSNGINFTKDLILAGETYDMVAQSDDYAVTLALMIFDEFKKYVEYRVFIKEKKEASNKKKNA